MSKRESQIIKGIAIILMVFYHLYHKENIFVSYHLTGLLGNSQVIMAINNACHVCVGLFVFVTAYGITIQENSRENGVKEAGKRSLEKALNLISKIAFVFLISLFLSYILNVDYGPESVWGLSKKSQALGILSNMCGIAGLLKIKWFNASWWYISFALLLVFVIPILHRAVKKMGPALSFFGTLFLIPSLGLSTSNDGIPRYCIIVILGIIFAEYSVYERIDTFLSKRQKLGSILALFTAIPCVICIETLTESWYLMDAVMTVILVLLIHLCISHISVFSDILFLFGKYSMNIWLTHTFIISYWFQEFTYSFQNIWLILLIVLAISLVLSFLLTKLYEITTWKLFEKLNSRNWGNLLMSASLFVLSFLLIYVTSEMTYLTNDDGGIQSLLSGNQTGSPYITHQFINVILGAIISALYKIIPNVQWWYVYSLFLIGVGSILIYFSVLRICAKKKIKFFLPFLLILWSCFGFLLYPISNVAFTIVPAILGTGLVSLLFLMDKIESKKVKVCLAVFIALGYVLCVLHRQASGMAILCYILLAVLYYMTSKQKLNIKLLLHYILICISFLVITAVLIIIQNYSRKTLNGAEWVEFNDARSAYMDYPHDTYWENPELFEEVGWNETTYELVNNWCFIDENVTTENFRHITENSKTNGITLAKKNQVLKNALSDRKCQAILSMWLLSFLLLLGFLFSRYSNRNATFLMLNNLGTMILILYQYLSGRILFRSLFVILLPAFMINLFLIIECCQKKSDCKILFVLIAFLCLPFTSSLFLETTFDDTSNNSKKATTAKSTQIEKYAIVNSDKVFIIPSGLYNNINPDALYPDEKPSNIISYGGSSYNAKSYRTALHNNGIDTLSGETFKRIDVYFICFGGYSPNSTLELFYQFLENGYGAIGFVQEDEILNSVYSYRFVFEENANDFDRYYSVVDGNIIEVQNEKSVEDAD